MHELQELAAQAHAAMAVLALRAPEAPLEGGYRSQAHWLVVETGVSLSTAQELVRVGEALRELPAIRGAFEDGRLSFDKVRALTQVAVPGDDEYWRDIGLNVNGAQLHRLVLDVRRVLGTDAERREKRGLWSFWTDDGMLRVRGLLPPEEGAVLQAALEAVVTAERSERGAETHAEDPYAARQADALVAIAEHALESIDTGLSAATDAARVVVHLEVGGGARLEDGPVVGESVARLIACDAERIEVREQGGLPVDVGHARRVAGAPLRRALHLRDRGCRVPGCGVPARRCHVHHIKHWADGGPTTLANTLLLCHFHHRRLHDGALSIEDCLRPRTPEPARGKPPRAPGNPAALEGGPLRGYAWTVDVLSEVALRSRGRWPYAEPRPDSG